MPDSTPSKNPVRVVYHAGDRTFARLFKERSLDELKDVVRRKLGLASQTDVSLKQMGHDALLDLEDDDDFQAFRVLLSSSVSVDIKVIVGSLGSTVSLPVSHGPVEHPLPNKPTATISSALPFGVASPSRFGVSPKVARTTEASATPAKTLDPSKRKRKVSFDGAIDAVSVESTGQHALAKPTAVTPVASAKAVESLATPKPVAPEEPAKKKQKKEPTKTKTKATDVQATEVAESPATKPSVSKSKSKKSTSLDRGSKAEISTSKAAETSEVPAKKQKRQKKVESTTQKKSSASIDQDPLNHTLVFSNDIGADQPSSAIDEAPLQSGNFTGLGVESDTLKTRKSEKIKAPKGTACAAIPQTGASVSVQSEVAAAILSGYLSKTSETMPPEPPAKRKSVKRVTKKSSGSSNALPAEPTSVLGVPANEVPSAPTVHRAEQDVLTNEPPQRADLNGPSCPICLETPFHIRYYCPTILKGPDAIRERLEGLKGTDMGDQNSLIKQLEDLLRDPKVTSKPLLDAVPTDGMQSGNASPALGASLLKTPNIPGNSCLSEVTVESRGEGNNSEGFDDMSEGRVEHQEIPTSRRQETQNDQPKEPLPSNGDLEAIIRGSASKKQSILQLFDRIVGDEDKEDMEEDKAELEEDPDEETGRSRCLPSRRTTLSSDSESEAGSRSPLLSRLAEDTSNNSGPGAQGPKKSGEESAERQEGDVAMRDSVDAPVLEGQDDGDREETHVGSEDHMIVDESTGEKRENGAAIVAGEQLSFPISGVSAAQPLDARHDELQESADVEAEPTPHQDGSVPAVSEIVGDIATDPIEPADDLTLPNVSRSSSDDPIELSFEDLDSLLPSEASSTPKPGVSKRIKTRNGRILEDEADHPVLLEQLDLEVTDKLTPIPPKGKLRRKATETPASQELATTRKSPRFNSLPPSTSTPVAVALLNHKSKFGALGKAVKTPAKQSGERIAATPSLIQWETLAEPSSPSVPPDEPLVLVDELMSSSPHPDDNFIFGRPNGKGKGGRTRKPASSGQAENSQEKERLFDPSSSQVPFPYSQNQTNSVVTVPDGKDDEETTDSEDEPKVAQKRTTTPAWYRTLSQLASQATLFSPSLPTPMPAKTSVSKGKAKEGAIIGDTSSSSSSDADGANGLEHIPRERRAGSVLEAKKRKGLLSGI